MKPALKTLKAFYAKLVNHNNDRFRSFEHCYLFFQKMNREKSFNNNKDLSMLHLGFYLASWGMYRGSSFLLQKDYKIYEPIIKIILKSEYIDLWDIENKISSKNIELFVEKSWELHTELLKELKLSRQEYHTYSDKSVKNEISSILTTKIIMGTLGCLPAYDRFFMSGISIYNKENEPKLVKTFSKNSIRKLFEFMIQNKEELKDIQTDIKEKTKVKYPLMKLIDSYFWLIGFEGGS